MSEIINDILFEFRRHKRVADRTIAQLDDETFFKRPGEKVNPVALIVKHLAGNLFARWTHFLTGAGEENRDRDAEFLLGESDTRENLLAAWESGWAALFDTIEKLSESDLAKTVMIRKEPHTVQQAMVRGLTHAAYHVGQIAYLVRLLKPEATWQTIAPGQSNSASGSYRRSQNT